MFKKYIILPLVLMPFSADAATYSYDIWLQWEATPNINNVLIITEEYNAFEDSFYTQETYLGSVSSEEDEWGIEYAWSDFVLTTPFQFTATIQTGLGGYMDAAPVCLFGTYDCSHRGYNPNEARGNDDRVYILSEMENRGGEGLVINGNTAIGSTFTVRDYTENGRVYFDQGAGTAIYSDVSGIFRVVANPNIIPTPVPASFGLLLAGLGLLGFARRRS